jgi:hypothetical protein
MNPSQKRTFNLFVPFSQIPNLSLSGALKFDMNFTFGGGRSHQKLAIWEEDLFDQFASLFEKQKHQ